MIRTKRDSLEQFIKEQLIGPGGCKGLYALKPDPAAENGTETEGEVISTTPGSIYSSAILFPPKKESKEEPITVEADFTPPNSEAEEPDESQDGTEEETKEEMDDTLNDDEDLHSLSRRFPTSMGISCCLDSCFARDNDLKITVSGRYYKKLQQHTRLEVVVEDSAVFDTFFKEHASLLDEWFELQGNKLSLRKTIPPAQLDTLKQGLRALNMQIASEIAKNPDGTMDTVFTDPTFKPQFRYLSSYKERLFRCLSSLKDGTYWTHEEAEAAEKRIKTIEQHETFFAYFDDLFPLFDRRNFGYWIEYPFSRELDLSTLPQEISPENGKVILSPKKYPCLKNIIAVRINENTELSLSAWLQLIKSSDNRTYLKILITNSSTEVATDDRHYYSIVSETVNERSFFGIKVEATSRHLCAYKELQADNLGDAEVHNLNFLYRTVQDYGVGHLCSVGWTKDEDGRIHVFSDFMPGVETPDVEPVPRDKSHEVAATDGYVLPRPYLENNPCLQFKWLSIFSDTPHEEILNGLLEFVSAYKTWIDSQRNSISGLEDPETADRTMDACEGDYQRMKNNVIEFLSDTAKMNAFRVMNAAMFMQLWHNKKANQQRVQEEKPPLDSNFYKGASDDLFPGTEHAAWRPFQLAFILLNLDGIYQSCRDTSWSKRNELVDLVWFPTGGGKTEAYLGLIALTIVNRRLTRGEAGYGVTAIMRYTLRLLTTQQFQRALRMILALEQIRQWDASSYNLGDEPISIGLFVGSQSLPNSSDDLKKECQQWANRSVTGNSSRIPLDVCPLCGSPLIYQAERNGVKFFCENIHCTYSDTSIPVQLCDDEIYQNPPTLLFGTVDKFAQLAYKVDTTTASRDSRRLFGRGEKWDKLPPDLIIQDELHLLLGPLGSAVSLYECAIDRLCARKEGELIIRPKIISSTATTRNTTLQVRALYDRAVSIFPKHGIDYDDSFFAFYKRRKKEGDREWSFVSKRKYIGIMPTGRTLMTTQMRLAAILFVHRAIFEKEHRAKLFDQDFIQAADYYFTTLSYFNSLKEVGKTDAQFNLEFTKYTRRLYKRVMRHSNMLECLYAYNDRFSKSELTGRLSGNEATAALNKVQSVTWDPNYRFPYQDEQGVWHNGIKPDDYILATNMISVGLDVSRFNVLIVNSMPRNIAEYIQASSRVARDKEGLVLTLHNPFRSRDVSHFEKFREFHEKLYFYVEPISITPFSHKSVDKYLPLFLGAYIRQLHPTLAHNKAAKNLNRDKARELEKEITEYFVVRFNRTASLTGIERELLTKELLDYITLQVHEMLEQWLQKAEESPNLVYNCYPRNPSIPSLYTSTADYDEIRQQNKWRVPVALRILEPEAVIHTAIK